MSRALYLLRHGETERGQCYLGRTDAALTARGWQQMSQGLKDCRPERFAQVVSSPLRRCAEFATRWAGDEQVRIDPRLAEYDFGGWDGLTGEQIHARTPRALERFWQDPWCYPPPQGESLAHFFNRLRALLETLDNSAWGPVLLICHGGVIRAIHCILHGHPINRMFDYPADHGSLHLFRR